MGVDATVTLSQGDVLRRLRDLEKLVERLAAERSLEAASVGRGGLRLHSGGGLRVDDGGDIIVRGGVLTIKDTAGDDMFRAGGQPGELFLRQDLLDPLAAAVLGSRVKADTISDSDLIDTDTYDDLATVGPTATGVPVTSGILIVWPSVSLGVAVGAGVSFSSEAYMSYEITGPTNVAPSDERAARLTLITTAEDAQVITRPAGAFVHAGLLAGSYTVRAKYRVGAADENSASANDRTLVALGI